jgi:cysteine desulfurase family protein
MIYLDNAATSWPKPPEVVKAVANFLECAGGNPGRSGHRLSIAAGRIVYETREAVAELFNTAHTERVVFTQNATQAINLVLRGTLHPGDRVVTTGIEHNAVMRPLRAMERTGVAVSVVPCHADGSLDLSEFSRALALGASLVVVNHACNVTGTLSPVAEVAEMVHRAGALLLVDAAQTAGVLPIDVSALKIDFLAFTGHKGLLGPPGTGGLLLGDRVDAARLEPLMRGGTGSRSDSEEQPEYMPDRFESGTPNGAGLAGLGAGVRYIMHHGLEKIRTQEVELARRLIAGLSAIPGVTVHGPADPKKQTAIVSFTIAERHASDIGLQLDEEFGILCRVGLHCAPAAHWTIGTFPQGTVRLAPGIFTTPEDVDFTLRAIEMLSTHE